jgi:hypothetical protein
MPGDIVVGVFDNWSQKYWCWDCFPQGCWELPFATLMFSKLYASEAKIYGVVAKCKKCRKSIYKKQEVQE